MCVDNERRMERGVALHVRCQGWHEILLECAGEARVWGTLEAGIGLVALGEALYLEEGEGGDRHDG